MTYAVTAGYDVKGRFASYWHQKEEIIRLEPKSLLECGIGNNFMYRYLGGLGIYHVTLDISLEFNPQVNGSVRSLPFQDNSFDVCVSFQTLEHLPYKNFNESLAELRRVSRQYVIISLPNRGLYFSLGLVAYPYRDTIRGMSVALFKKEHVFDGNHYWELGKKNFPVKKIIADIKREGLNILNHYRVPEKPFHHFFILEKNNN